MAEDHIQTQRIILLKGEMMRKHVAQAVGKRKVGMMKSAKSVKKKPRRTLSFNLDELRKIREALFNHVEDEYLLNKIERALFKVNQQSIDHLKKLRRQHGDH